MPKFDASSVEPCEYDFTGIKGTDGEFIQDKGEVPEPSRQLVKATMSAVAAAYRDVSGEEIEETPDAIADAMKKLDTDEAFERMADGTLGALIDFCQGHPSKESLEKLTWPRFMAFFGYIMENMLSPEASKPAAKQPVRTLRSV